MYDISSAQVGALRRARRQVLTNVGSIASLSILHAVLMGIRQALQVVSILSYCMPEISVPLGGFPSHVHVQCLPRAPCLGYVDSVKQMF